MITIASFWIVALAVLLLLLARNVRTVQRMVRCPIRGTDVRMPLHEALSEGRPIEVTACSAFTPPTAITCDQPSLVLGRGATRPIQ